jgi:hypothetical protein
MCISQLLAVAHIMVGYYPPPSREEEVMIQGADAGSNFRRGDPIRGISSRERVCARCGALSTPEGGELMKCSRCRKVSCEAQLQDIMTFILLKFCSMKLGG